MAGPQWENMNRMSWQKMKVKYDSKFSQNDVYDNTEIVSDFYEYEEKSGACGIKVCGRLKDHVSFWREIGAPDFIVDTIDNGYIIPFYDLPASQYYNNNKSAVLYITHLYRKLFLN